MIRKQIIGTSVAFMMLALIVQSARSSDGDGDKKQRLTIIGKVVAYEQSALGLVRLTFVPNTQVFVVRVERLIKGQEESYYIKVQYQYWHNEPNLPSEIFDSKKQWRFKLNRQPSCDGSLQALESANSNIENRTEMALPRLERAPGAEAENIPTDAALPCYKLRPRDFKLSGSARRKQ